MKHLIIYAHPNPASFNNGIKDTLVEASKAEGHEVVIRDLYALNFNPTLTGQDLVGFRSGNIPADIKAEQEFVTWADVITFVYPLWWTGLPAILKGYVDRVYSYGFAYTMSEKGIVQLLSDKKVLAFTTAGTPNEYYEASGMLAALEKTSDVGIFEFCGMKVVAHKQYGGIPASTPEQRASILEEVKQTLKKALVPAHLEEVTK